MGDHTCSVVGSGHSYFISCGIKSRNEAGGKPGNEAKKCSGVSIKIT